MHSSLVLDNLEVTHSIAMGAPQDIHNGIRTVIDIFR